MTKKVVDLSGEKEQNWLNDARRRLRAGEPPEGMSLDDVLHENDGKPITVREFIAQKKREDELAEQEAREAEEDDDEL